jgi:hypothetical protein
MSSINTLRKVATAAVVGAAFFASSANAFTLVNHAAPTNVQVSNVGFSFPINGTNPINMASGSTLAFDYFGGGTVKFLLSDTQPDFKTVSFTLTQGVDTIANWTLTEVADGLAKPFYALALAAGSYTLKLSTTAGQSGVAISAVPVPGAALLFGTTVLGFLGLSKRRKS